MSAAKMNWTFDWAMDMGAWTPMAEQMASAPGLYIVAGVSGSGKDAAAKSLCARCESLGLPAIECGELLTPEDWIRAKKVCCEEARVVATIHASEVLRVRERLIQWGASAKDLDSIRGVSAQMLVNRFDQSPDDKLVWPTTVLSSYALFFEGIASASLPEWDVLVTLRQDAVNKMLRGLMGKNAVDGNLARLARARQTMTLAELLAAM
jgi:hypothetical protein